MNPKAIFSLLLGTGLGTMSDDAESAWIPASLFKSAGVKDSGIDALETFSKVLQQRAANFNPEGLPRLDRTDFNKQLWNYGEVPHSGGKQIQSNRYLYDDAGNLQVWADDHWNMDEMMATIRNATKRDPQFGARNQFRLDELMDDQSEVARVAPELFRNSTVHLSPLGPDTGGNALYHPSRGGGKITLNSDIYSNLDAPHVQYGLFNVMEHELTHLLQGRAGQQGGAAPSWFGGGILNRTADEAYNDTLGERMARAAGYYRAAKTDPLVTLNRNVGQSILPDELIDPMGQGYPYRSPGYGSMYPHQTTGSKVTNAVKSMAKEVASDPSTWLGLLAGPAGIVGGLGIAPTMLGDSEQLPEGELQRQMEEAKAMGLISAITGGGF